MGKANLCQSIGGNQCLTSGSIVGNGDLGDSQDKHLQGP